MHWQEQRVEPSRYLTPCMQLNLLRLRTCVDRVAYEVASPSKRQRRRLLTIAMLPVTVGMPISKAAQLKHLHSSVVMLGAHSSHGQLRLRLLTAITSNSLGAVPQIISILTESHTRTCARQARPARTQKMLMMAISGQSGLRTRARLPLAAHCD